MSEKRDEKWSSLGMALAILLVALVPLLYVLSIGPAALIYERSNGEAEWIAIPYTPLMLLIEAVPALQPMMQWYLELWVEDPWLRIYGASPSTAGIAVVAPNCNSTI